MLMTTVQLPGAPNNDSRMVMNTVMSNTDISIETVFRKHISDPTRAHELIYHGKYSKKANNHKWMEH